MDPVAVTVIIEPKGDATAEECLSKFEQLLARLSAASTSIAVYSIEGDEPTDDELAAIEAEPDSADSADDGDGGDDDGDDDGVGDGDSDSETQEGDEIE